MKDSVNDNYILDYATCTNKDGDIVKVTPDSKGRIAIPVEDIQVTGGSTYSAVVVYEKINPEKVVTKTQNLIWVEKDAEVVRFSVDAGKDNNGRIQRISDVTVDASNKATLVSRTGTVFTYEFPASWITGTKNASPVLIANVFACLLRCFNSLFRVYYYYG